MLGRLFFAALFILAARLLGAQTFGLYSYAVSVATLALIGMDLGLNTLFVREGARHPQEVPFYAGTVLLLKSILALLILAGVWIFCHASDMPSQTKALVMAVSLIQALAGLTDLGLAGLNALEHMGREALVKSVSRATAFIVAGTLLLAGGGVWGLVAGLLASNVLAAGMSLFFLASYAGFRLRLKATFWGRLWKKSLPLALTSIFILVYFRVDMIMLEYLGRSYEEIGWYAAGVKIIEVLGMVPALVSAALLPVLSSLASTQTEELAKLYRQGRRLLMIIGLPAAMGLWWVRQAVPLLIFGPQYAQTTQALSWLAPMIAIMFLNFMQLTLLTAMGLQRLCAISTGLCVAVNIGLNFFLIPHYGFVGAAAATLITEVVLFIQTAWFIRIHLGPSLLLASTWRPASAAALMALLLYFAADWNLALSILLGIMAYLTALIALKGITWLEIKDLVQIIKGAVPRTVKENH